jgi:hypothetical protein
MIRRDASILGEGIDVEWSLVELNWNLRAKKTKFLHLHRQLWQLLTFLYTVSGTYRGKTASKLFQSAFDRFVKRQV